MKALDGLEDVVVLQLLKGEVLPVMEEFHTIQGEGFHSGKAAWFVRVGGCDVGCHWCDVKESWNPKHFPPKPTSEVVSNAIACNAKTVVVTGGEPLTYNLDELCKELTVNDIKIHLETSGSNRISGRWDWICLSPKKNKPPVEQIYRLANELKVIISDPSDLDWAIENASRVRPDCVLYLQPEWSKRDKAMPIIVDFILKNPRWMVSIQSHKYLRIP